MPSFEKVYPRVGGGNMGDGIDTADREGLSPRGRGKLTAHFSETAFARSIPAWAGETSCGARSWC